MTVTKPSIITIGKDKVATQTIQIGQITITINCKLIITINGHQSFQN